MGLVHDTDTVNPFHRVALSGPAGVNSSFLRPDPTAERANTKIGQTNCQHEPMSDARGQAADDRSEIEPEVDLVMVTMMFDAADAATLLGVLSKYIVLARMQAGCRNIDLAASATTPGRFIVVQKWDSAAAQQAHFDSVEMVEMARACTGLLTAPPLIDLLEPISAHDLR
jgi:quinol monooxygenase YgiN